MLYPAQKNAFYVVKQINYFFCIFFLVFQVLWAPLTIFAYFSNFHIFCTLFQAVNSYHFTSIVNIGAQHHPVVEDKSLKTQDQVSFVPVEAKEVDPAAVKGNRTMSSAN